MPIVSKWEMYGILLLLLALAMGAALEKSLRESCINLRATFSPYYPVGRERILPLHEQPYLAESDDLSTPLVNRPYQPPAMPEFKLANLV